MDIKINETERERYNDFAAIEDSMTFRISFVTTPKAVCFKTKSGRTVGSSWVLSA